MSLWNLFQTVFAGPSTTASAAGLLQLRVISFNIRYATPSLFPNERPWAEREPLVVSQLLHELRFANASQLSLSGASVDQPAHSSAFVCLQEVLHNQLVDVLAALNKVPIDEKPNEPSDGPDWAHIGVGREDGYAEGEYNPIIYAVKTFELLHYETVWLSPTPDRPSKGWGAGSFRILTVGVFEHKQTRQRLIAANTHLDNESSESRFESVEIILSTLRRVHHEWSQERKLGVFLTGDFNSFPEQEAYIAMKEDGWMSDLHEDMEPQARYGEDITFTGFEPDNSTDEQGRIDYIWLGPTTGHSDSVAPNPWTPLGYAVLPNVFDDKVFLSDHRAVIGDLKLGYA